MRPTEDSIAPAGRTVVATHRQRASSSSIFCAAASMVVCALCPVAMLVTPALKVSAKKVYFAVGGRVAEHCCNCCMNTPHGLCLNLGVLSIRDLRAGR